MSKDEIREHLGADSLGYLSHDGMLAALDDVGESRHCTACFSGRYPVAVARSGQDDQRLEKARA
jgi:amidophosphoribosyltransferase